MKYKRSGLAEDEQSSGRARPLTRAPWGRSDNAGQAWDNPALPRRSTRVECAESMWDYTAVKRRAEGLRAETLAALGRAVRDKAFKPVLSRLRAALAEAWNVTAKRARFASPPQTVSK